MLKFQCRRPVGCDDDTADDPGNVMSKEGTASLLCPLSVSVIVRED